MSQVTEQLQALGQFEIRLTDDAPRSLRASVDLFDHIIITPSRVDLALLGDTDDLSTDPAGASELLFPSETLYPAAELFAPRSRIYDAAVYTGVVRRLPRGDSPAIVGTGLAAWLGDEDDKGPLFETDVTFTAVTFVDAITALTPVALEVGDIEALTGTYSDTVNLQTARQAIDYVCGIFGAEWRIRPGFVLDAGSIATLYGTGPTGVAVRRGIGWDIDFDALPLASIEVDEDARDYTTRTLLIGQGSGEDVVIGAADGPATPYVDPQGNPVQVTRMVFESDTSAGNANARAQLQQNRFAGIKRAVSIDLADYEVDGSARVGATIYVFDPDAGLYDLDTEIAWRGETIWPIALRVLGASWPVKAGMGVYWRNQSGVIVDITDHVQTSSGDTQLTVGARPRNLLALDRQREALRQRLNA